MSTEDAAARPLVILIPVYNDWESLRLLLPRIDECVAGLGLPVEVLIVDDGSTEPPPQRLDLLPANVRAVRVLELRRNLGHQRAICIGLSYLQETVACRAVAVMDGDGEDDPADLPRLFARFLQEQERAIVFAGRARRSESPLFKVFYLLYKAVHRVLTGPRVEVGNFSIVPAAQLRRLVVVSELWNHFAAAVFSARLPRVIVATARGRRLSGGSKMNFVSLVTHGLSAISVFGERVGVRVLVAVSSLAVLIVASLVVVLIVKLTTGLAVPGWATYTSGLLMIILLQMVMLASIYIVLVLGSRQGIGFLPLRDYRYFCGDSRVLYP
jgi:glycosyltransferase involved in cell wall biosynthesis